MPGPYATDFAIAVSGDALSKDSLPWLAGNLATKGLVPQSLTRHAASGLGVHQTANPVIPRTVQMHIRTIFADDGAPIRGGRVS